MPRPPSKIPESGALKLRPENLLFKGLPENLRHQKKKEKKKEKKGKETKRKMRTTNTTNVVHHIFKLFT